MACLFAAASAEVQTHEAHRQNATIKRAVFAPALLLAEFRILPSGNGKA